MSAVIIDPKTGDGCGITWYGLDQFFQKHFPNLGLSDHAYSVIPVCLSHDSKENQKSRELLQTLLQQEELKISAERFVPTQRSLLGWIGQQQEPLLHQFIVMCPYDVTREEFEKKLIRMRLRFELAVQDDQYSVRPHIFSASSYYVIYKSLIKEDKIAEYFIDFSDPTFQASAGVVHARFATNTLPAVKNIQPLSKFANNGENNALQKIVRLLSLDPFFKKILDVPHIHLQGLSDSHIMSIYMDLLHLLDFPMETIVSSTIQAYEPGHAASSQYYNLFGVPFEGPNASIITMGHKIIIVRDKNGFRPQRGIMNQNEFYCGSELGVLEMSGEVFDLSPGQPLVVDMAEGTLSLYKPE